MITIFLRSRRVSSLRDAVHDDQQHHGLQALALNDLSSSSSSTSGRREVDAGLGVESTCRRRPPSRVWRCSIAGEVPSA